MNDAKKEEEKVDSCGTRTHDSGLYGDALPTKVAIREPIDFACWLGSLAQSVERQRIKLRVVGSSPAGVQFFFFLSITHMMPQ